MLAIGGVAGVEDPSEQDIREAVFSLDTRDGESFLILDAPASRTFLQTSGDRDVGFELAYQDSALRQYRAKRDFSSGEIVRALNAFRQGSMDWKNGTDWEFVGEAELPRAAASA